MEIFGTIVDFLNSYVWAFPEKLPWLVVVLLGSGFYVSLRLAFIQLRQVPHALKVVAGKYDDPAHKGDISHFQALSTALSATVGIGNIAGVATAIHYGGPGALFWMWLTAFFGMALKYAECTLSMQYREFDAKGNASGGPMYYIQNGLGQKWKPLAILFAFCGIICSFGSGNMNQANTVSISATTELGVSAYAAGIITAVLVGAVIIGGIKRIAQVSSKLAPSMALLYVASALVILILHAPEVPAAFVTIFADAFTPKASVGGSVAGAFSVTLLWGVKRGLFSNEAGQGSAPIAHAAAKTDEPIREGAVAMLGPLIDTLLICTMTGLVIISTGVWDKKHDGALPISHTRAIPASLIAPTAETEALRINQALEKLEKVGSSTTTQKIDVVNGKQQVLQFLGRECMVEELVLLDPDKKPFNGALAYNADTEKLTPANLTVSGKMLQNSSALTALAFQVGLSSIGENVGNFIVTLCVFLFALSTIISWSYYGDRCVTYLWGSRYVLAYRVLYTAFAFLGSILALEVVWAYGDLALGLMSIPNLIAVVLLMPKLVVATREYFTRMKGS